MTPHEGALETYAQATRRVIRFSIGYLLAVLLTAGLTLAGAMMLRAGTVDPLSPGTRAGFVLGGMVAGLLVTISVIGLVVSTIVWIISAHRVTPAGPGAAGYTGLFVAVASATAGFVVNLAALQLVAWVALIAGVVLTRSRIRRLTGLADLGGRVRPTVTSDDWDASKWDPDVVKDIERRGRPTP
ncbi:hypothetical protein [Actinoplanes couchii]|uniref:Uncharacterized protein n=1 Tax=Actinoplanes couchii TaxID=403638 RepID=A0ABQ3X4P5_9ACTN|nr:hypothetical protein [Actinoplanes couchii]MDR6326179.1 hypothetical protein [Actinoplanes couchii]GID53468.1 hypothetical protein Aco03nite_018720 [Actinoplanes couchii]